MANISQNKPKHGINRACVFGLKSNSTTHVMSYGDAWDARDRSRETGLRRIRDAFDALKWFLAGAFSGAVGVILLTS